jgi:DNA-binding GntR family transcriptional regulator
LSIEIIDRVHGNVCGNALEKLRRDIILRRYPPGTRLLEADLARDLAVSRGSVRVALQDLIKEGLIEETLEGRKIVPAITKSTIEDMYELRAWLELKAVEVLLSAGAIRYSPLLGVLGEIERDDPDRGVEDYYKIDVLFHKTILQMSGNRAILQAWETMSSVIYSLLSVNASREYRDRYMREFRDKHKGIIDLFILRDRGCLDLMRRHIEDSKELTLGVLHEIDRGAY